jgi:hypothetical protein
LPGFTGHAVWSAISGVRGGRLLVQAIKTA